MTIRLILPSVLLAAGLCLCRGENERGPRQVVERDGKSYLFGGEDSSQDFDVTKFRLNPAQLHYGIGREKFAALIAPEFLTAGEANGVFPDTEPVLGLSIDGEAKAYPISLLTRHEVVNDVVGGKPIFAAYCVLADLGAVYDRQLAGHTYTFALSGYTYSDPKVWGGLQAFVLWDRDTGSLWLPTIGKGVSGPMIDVPLQLIPQEDWERTTWSDFKAKHPNAVVLKPNQEMKAPESWKPYEGPFPEKEKADADKSIPPRHNPAEAGSGG